jgi:predicted lipid-binding transport protein (Tim44 family)
MKRLFALALLVMFGVMSTGIEHAEAKRFGGGMSFGKQRTAQSQTSFGQRQATSQKAAANGQRGSARPGFMGAIAGLALGGLLGALFFGGAFEGINLFDIVILGVIAFFIISLLRRRAAGMSRPMAYAGADAGRTGYAPQQPSGMPQSGTTAGRAVRPQIDAQHFTAAARDIFMRMQAAWDARDMDEIHRFCNADIGSRIEQDMQAAGDRHSHTEVGMLNAAILDSWVESDSEWVAVHFTAMLREQTLDAAGSVIEDTSHEVNETWIFNHDPTSDDPTWYLAGIQQA